MADEVYECEARLTALRARKQRWLARYAAVENVAGKAAARAGAKSNIKLCDELIAEAEKRLCAAQRAASIKEGREVTEGENMAARDATELDEIARLASSCDEHAAALGVAVKELHSKITALRMRNNRGPSGLMVTAALERCAAKHFAGTTILRMSRGPFALQHSFRAQTDLWAVMLGSAPLLAPPPPSPPPRDKGYERPLVGASLAGGPTFR